MIWLALGLLLGIALLFVIVPLQRRTENAAGDPALAVYRQQLSEVDADRDRGLISASEAYAARAEIERKILALPEQNQTQRDPLPAARRVRMVAGVALPVIAAGLYLSIGQPNLPGQDFAARPSDLLLTASTAPAEPARLDGVETMVVRLAERLKREPDDLEGWQLLGMSYASLERFPEAAKGYQRAIALAPQDAALRALYGETLVNAAGGKVTAEAAKAFDAALVRDAKETRALFYRGVSFEQSGQPQQALAVWTALLRNGDPKSPVMSEVRDRASALAQRLGRPFADEPPKTGADSVESLSARLEKNAQDIDGWLALADAYRARDQREMARASLARARQLFQGAPFLLQRIDDAERSLGEPPATRGPSADDVAAAQTLTPGERAAMVDGMVSRLEQRLKRAPDDLDGWLMLMRSKTVLGDKEAARASARKARDAFAANTAALARIDQAATELGLN